MSKDNAYQNVEMQVFHAELANRVRVVHGKRCPCCARVMVPPGRTKQKARRDLRTVAHDLAVGYGGDPTVWVFACFGCNHDQGMLTFRLWSQRLRMRGDERAGAVAALADMVEKFTTIERVEG